MEITNKEQLLEFIRTESLKLLKENEAFSSLGESSETLDSPKVDVEKKLDNIDKHFVDVTEKEFEKLQREESAAVEKEDYVELQRIKKDKVSVLGKLIASYQKKIEYLQELKNGMNQELEQLGVQGNGVFKNKPMNEFSNEDFQKGQTVKIDTISSELTLKKVSENNSYQVLKSTATGILPGDLLALPINMKIGSSAEVSVYRNMGGRHEEIAKPVLKNITQILKNPV